MKNFIVTNKESFFKLFEDSDRYKWIGNKSKDLDWWEAHINFVYDTELEKTVGYSRTSSWNCDTDYGVLESLSTVEMLKWYEDYLESRRLKRIEQDEDC